MSREYYTYLLRYPKGYIMGDGTDVSGIVFYVGKGTAYRLNGHRSMAASKCKCEKCEAIRSIWDAGYDVVQEIVFKTTDAKEALRHERLNIKRYQGFYLVNVQHAVKRDTKPSYDREWVHDTWGASRFCDVRDYQTFAALADEYNLPHRMISRSTRYRVADLLPFREWVARTYPSKLCDCRSVVL